MLCVFLRGAGIAGQRPAQDLPVQPNAKDGISFCRLNLLITYHSLNPGDCPFVHVESGTHLIR
jgi:hypothetical protein